MAPEEVVADSDAEAFCFLDGWMNRVLLDSIDTISFPYHVFALRGPLIDDVTIC